MRGTHTLFWGEVGGSSRPPSNFVPAAADMAVLAEELFPCRAELLSGGLEGSNRPRILRHLLGGLPLLVPYPAVFFLGGTPQFTLISPLNPPLTSPQLRRGQ